MQTFSTSEGIKDVTKIYLAKTEAKQANSKMSKILSALWETFAQSGSRVKFIFLCGDFCRILLRGFCCRCCHCLLLYLGPVPEVRGVPCPVLGVHLLARLFTRAHAPVFPLKAAADKTEFSKDLSGASSLKERCSCWGKWDMLITPAELGPNYKLNNNNLLNLFSSWLRVAPNNNKNVNSDHMLQIALFRVALWLSSLWNLNNKQKLKIKLK